MKNANEAAGQLTKGFSAGADPEQWIEEHGDYLYRFALVRVRAPEIAEDLVQDTFLAGVRSVDRFRGNSSERTWLFGILKHKIFDYFRRRGREISFTDLEFLEDEMPHKFGKEGFWNHDRGPAEWKQKADESMQHSEFWVVLQSCLSRLPTRVANVFMLREVEQLETVEICEALRISQNNLG
jgi:RNA polymerase sigma-70 factor, ECF subfamily